MVPSNEGLTGAETAVASAAAVAVLRRSPPAPGDGGTVRAPSETADCCGRVAIEGDTTEAGVGWLSTSVAVTRNQKPMVKPVNSLTLMICRSFSFSFSFLSSRSFSFSFSLSFFEGFSFSSLAEGAGEGPSSSTEGTSRPRGRDEPSGVVPKRETPKAPPSPAASPPSRPRGSAWRTIAFEDCVADGAPAAAVEVPPSPTATMVLPPRLSSAMPKK